MGTSEIALLVKFVTEEFNSCHKPSFTLTSTFDSKVETFTIRMDYNGYSVARLIGAMELLNMLNPRGYLSVVVNDMRKSLMERAEKERRS